MKNQAIRQKKNLGKFIDLFIKVDKYNKTIQQCPTRNKLFSATYATLVSLKKPVFVSFVIIKKVQLFIQLFIS